MKTIIFLAVLFLASILLVRCKESDETPLEPATVELTPKMKIKRGKYLVNSMGCDDCHSPKIMTEHGFEPDPKRRLSGHPANEPIAEVKDKTVLKDYVLFGMGLTHATGPWGTSFAANLTPGDTGIGNWAEEQFFKAIREGKFKGLDGGRSLLPPMPWFVYRNLSDEDLSSIFAFLKSLPPVSNVVPSPIAPK